MSQNLKFLKRDRDLFYRDLNSDGKFLDNTSDRILVSDFTEYNPLHNGHFH